MISPSWLRKLLFKPVLWASGKFSSKPERPRVFKALTDLHQCIMDGEKKKGLVIPFDSSSDKFIIFSDQHKGAGDGADDFLLCEPNYLAALDHYYNNNFFLIALGDCEELWENSLSAVKKRQKASLEKESLFFKSQRGVKIFGNHDLYWKNDPLASFQLKEIFGCDLPIYEGMVLQTKTGNKEVKIFCTHGHQGDAVSDGNWFSKFFVSRIWAPLQALLRINPNTPAYDARLKTLHNSIMYEWSAAQDHLFLITGHTHQPVFESLTHIERLYRQLLFAREMKDKDMEATLQQEIRVRKFEYDHISPDYLSLKPTYFNSGCCCYSDGDITGIEIDEDCIRLVKWHAKEGASQRILLAEAVISELLKE